jgi:hypothetical protein
MPDFSLGSRSEIWPHSIHYAFLARNSEHAIFDLPYSIIGLYLSTK